MFLIGANAYHLDLHLDIPFCLIFNIENLSAYFGHFEEECATEPPICIPTYVKPYDEIESILDN